MGKNPNLPPDGSPEGRPPPVVQVRPGLLPHRRCIGLGRAVLMLGGQII
jgi:hypothetical protein